jgi:hypothetical protein
MSSLSLYEIASEYRKITEILMDSGCDEQALIDTLEGEQWDLQCKAQNYGFVIRNLQATAASIRDAEKQMSDRRKAIEKRAEILLERLKTGLEIAGVSKIECPHFALTIKKNPAAVEVFEPSLIPQSFMRTPEPPPPSPDKAAIKAALQSGADVPGAHMVQGTRLDIK